MMKKIFAILFMIMMSCQACVAFEPPDPDRWVNVQTGNNISCWLDAKTLRFDKKYGENYANVWAIMQVESKAGHSMNNLEFNMDKREFRLLSVVEYDDNGKVTASSSIPSRFEGVTPRSLIEVVYEVVAKVYDMANQNTNKSAVSRLNR